MYKSVVLPARLATPLCLKIKHSGVECGKSLDSNTQIIPLTLDVAYVIICVYDGRFEYGSGDS